MIKKIILASKSNIRKKILEKNGINCLVYPSNINETTIKENFFKKGKKTSPKLISIFLARLKAQKISSKSCNKNKIVLGADSVIDINGELISKPQNRKEALKILKKLNGKTHYLISSVCICKNGLVLWNYNDKAALTMKKMSNKELKTYLAKINDHDLYSYNVYQIEGKGKFLFSKIDGDKNTIMGLPIKQIKKYLKILI